VEDTYLDETAMELNGKNFMPGIRLFLLIKQTKIKIITPIGLYLLLKPPG